MSKDLFINVFQDNICRAGSDALLKYLLESDFFTAPASTRYHNCFEGGLCMHSLNVYERLKQLLPTYYKETLAICGLLHDVCKIGFYKPERKSRKTGQTLPSGKPEWEDYMGYAVEDKLPFGHGEKSVFIIERFMRLTTDEAMAIRWHMGEFERDKACSLAYEKYPLAVCLHIADLQATYLDERRGG